jgi:N-acyl-phosphatidylethanolamine-hydrolysing phospholipase D
MHTGKPFHHRLFGFRNPEGSRDVGITFRNTIKYLHSRLRVSPPEIGKDVPADFVLGESETLAGFNHAKEASTEALAWLGHCSFLLAIGGTTILTDPFLDGIAGPSWLRGLERIPSPLPPERLPHIDILLQSHAHYDHLHAPSLKRIPVSSDTQVIAPLRVGRKFRRFGYRNITELDWHDVWENDTLRIRALPAIHYSEQMFGWSLWAGFSIESLVTGKRIYFSGDTGYGPIFARDIAAYGPFDVACIGVGGYRVDSYASAAPFVHTNPEEALHAGLEIGAKRLIGMHCGTVRMTDETLQEITKRLGAAAEGTSLEGKARVLNIGETMPL